MEEGCHHDQRIEEAQLDVTLPRPRSNWPVMKR